VALARRRMDDASDAGPPGRLEDVERAPDVRVDERLRRDVGVRDRDERREMEDDLDSVGGRLDEPGVADVAEPDVDRASGLGLRLIEPAGRATRVIEAEGADAGALRDEPLG